MTTEAEGVVAAATEAAAAAAGAGAGIEATAPAATAGAVGVVGAQMVDNGTLDDSCVISAIPRLACSRSMLSRLLIRATERARSLVTAGPVKGPMAVAAAAAAAAAAGWGLGAGAPDVVLVALPLRCREGGATNGTAGRTAGANGVGGKAVPLCRITQMHHTHTHIHTKHG